MEFTHFNEQGKAKMVDVSSKNETTRTACAKAIVQVNKDTFEKIKNGGIKKGDVLTVAQVAGIMGAKKTSELIPMCHPIMIEGCNLYFQMDENNHTIEIISTLKCDGKTGIEMEALTAVSVAALTIIDMCKALQRDICIKDIHLLSKTGGKSDYRSDKNGLSSSNNYIE